MHRQIIIIPGIMGSALQYKKLKIWPFNIVTWSKGINVLMEKLEDIESEDIKAVGLYEKYYGKLVEFSESLADEVTPFDYDWRKNNFKHIEELKNAINPRADEVIIIAHSMGGILSKLLLTSDQDDSLLRKVTKLITIGTPWNGAAKSYIQLKFGMGLPFIRGVFKPVIPHLESVYQLLPNQKYLESNQVNFGYGFLNNEDWNTVRNNYYLDILKKNGLNADQILYSLYERMNKELPDWVEHHEIIGYGKTTLTSLNNDGIKVKGKFGNGDGTVPLHSGISDTERKYFVKDAHDALPKNGEVHRILERIIKNNESFEYIVTKEGLLSCDEVINARFKFKVVRVACPVDVSLLDESGNVIYGDMSEMNQTNLFDMILNGDESVQHLDGDVYFIIADDKKKKLHVEAYEKGAVEISIEEYEKGKLEKIARFKTFNMDESKTAEIDISNDVEECNVKLLDGQVYDIESKVINYEPDRKEIILPKTTFELIGDYVKWIDDKNYIAAENVFLSIKRREPGSHEIIDTFYSLNGDHSVVIDVDKNVEISLEKGKNTIIVYSTDIFGNVEKIKETNIFYYGKKYDRLPKIKLRAQPDSCTLIYELKENKDLEKLSLLSPKVEFIYENEEKVLFNYIKNENVLRNIRIRLTDELGVITSEPFFLDERLLNLIFDSKANLNDYKGFLESIGINEIKTYKTIQNNKRSFYRNLNISKLSDADILEFKNDLIEVTIDKKREYDIMFSSLREYISLGENNSYAFQFSVFNNDINIGNNNKDIELKIFLASEATSRATQYIFLDEIEYKIEDEKYIFNLKSQEIRTILLKSEEIESEVKELYILICDGKSENKILRVCELDIM